jgi:hypothetical protein
MPVESGPADTDALADLINSDAMEALLVEELSGRVQNLPFPIQVNLG